MRRSAVVAAGLGLIAGAALLPSAASSRDGEPALTLIAGQAVSCRDVRGAAVHTVEVANLGDVGRAGVVNRVPVIVIDPHLINRLPDKLQVFFYQHECAHHVLGHWYAGGPDQEKDADCWAIRQERDSGHLSRDDVMSFAPFLAASGGSPFGHLPGPERSRYLLKCFDNTLEGNLRSSGTTAAAP